jgi:hypothetical protein
MAFVAPATATSRLTPRSRAPASKFTEGTSWAVPTWTVRVYRPPEEVFSADALKSFAHRPSDAAAPEHPRYRQELEAIRRRAHRRRGGARRRVCTRADGHDGSRPSSMPTRKMASRNCRWVTPPTSSGVTGVTDAGEPYDAVQTAIRGNHLAVVPLVSCGDSKAEKRSDCVPSRR